MELARTADSRLMAPTCLGEEPRVRVWVAVGLAGVVGALARYGLDGVVSRRFPGAFPWGTFVVNITGCLLAGFLVMILTDRFATPAWLRSGVTIGLLGSYTTFSTFSVETYRLIEDGSIGLAVANVGANLLVGLFFVYVGMTLGRAV